MLKQIFLLFLILVFNSTYSQEIDDDEIDFSPPSGAIADEDNLDCTLSKDDDLIGLLNFKLKKFNPTSKEFESGPPLTAEETKHKAIRFYSLQLKEPKNSKN